MDEHDDPITAALIRILGDWRVLAGWAAVAFLAAQFSGAPNPVPFWFAGTLFGLVAAIRGWRARA
jgi:hypothetical protein